MQALIFYAGIFVAVLVFALYLYEIIYRASIYNRLAFFLYFIFFALLFTQVVQVNFIVHTQNFIARENNFFTLKFFSTLLLYFSAVACASFFVKIKIIQQFLWQLLFFIYLNAVAYLLSPWR